MLKTLVQLLRLKQWAKNLLVFAAWMFAGKYTDREAVFAVLIAFFSMGFASSGVYIVNDVLDRERDRNHPRKKFRPIASGEVGVGPALVLAAILVAGALAMSWYLTPTCLALVVTYLLLQVAYNLKLKSVPVLDVFCIAVGFVLRAVLGASALVLPISGWFLFCTGFLALMMGFAKRRNEFLLCGNGANESRESLAHYSKSSLDALVAMFATGSVLFYGIYTLQSTAARSHPALVLTAPFVFYGVSRYMFLVFHKDEGGEPADLLFGDWHIVGSVVGFVAVAVLAINGLALPFLEP